MGTIIGIIAGAAILGLLIIAVVVLTGAEWNWD